LPFLTPSSLAQNNAAVKRYHWWLTTLDILNWSGSHPLGAWSLKRASGPVNSTQFLKKTVFVNALKKATA
jgi:hypothetical protein